MRNLRYFLATLFLITITSCTTTHQRLLNTPLGLTTSDVVERFGSPAETIDDVNFTHWIYRTETQHPSSKIPRKWLIKYSFQQGTLVEISPEMVPHPDEIKKIEEQAQERLKLSDPKNKESQDGEFKSL